MFFVTLVPATKLRTDIAADNVYYLGFLYTLTSLAVAIAVENPEETILQNFGVAIVSTLIGIAARVGLNQLRVDPHDIEEATRIELSDATRRVRAEMDETVLQISNFRNLSMQVMSEGYEEVKENIDKASKDLMKSIEEVVNQSTGPLQELAEKTKAASEQAVDAISEVTKTNQKLAKSSKAMSDGIEKANEALVALAEHYNDSDVIDEKVLSRFQDKMEEIQTKFSNDISTALKTQRPKEQENRGMRPLRALRDSILGAQEDYVEHGGKQINVNKAGEFKVSGVPFPTLDAAKKHIDEQDGK